MNALILAAGRGTRIRSVHADRPKCLIPTIDRRTTILDHQIESLLDAGVARITLVVGYEWNQIFGHVQTRYRSERDRFQFIINPDYAQTNNIYSLWLARKAMNGDSFVCLNADVVYDARVLAPALESKTPITMIVDPEWRDETMKVIINGDRVTRMSKAIGRDQFSGTYIGITAFSAAINEPFFRRISHLVQSGEVNGFFNVAVEQLANDGVHVGYSSTKGLAWAEIDDPGDLAFARQHIFPRISQYALAA